MEAAEARGKACVGWRHRPEVTIGGSQPVFSGGREATVGIGHGAARIAQGRGTHRGHMGPQ